MRGFDRSRFEPRVLLLHGAGGNAHSFDELLPHLYGLDTKPLALPGRPPTGGAPLRSVAEAATWLLEEVLSGSECPTLLVGHSLGGAVALEASLRAPERVTGLVMMASGARLRVHPFLLNLVYEAAARGEVPTPRPGLWQPTTPPAVMDRADAHARLTPPAAIAADWQMATAFDRLGDVAQLAVPTLIIAGEKDTLTPPKYARWLFEQIEDAREVTLAGAGHLFPVEAPGLVGPVILRFVAELGESWVSPR